MARNSRYKDAAEKRERGGFASMAYVVVRSESFRRLGAFAVKLLMELVSQYNGNNNGDLCAAWTLMKARGWRSKSTLHKALKELLAGEWIEVSRRGGRHKATLYALTFYAVDHCQGKLDIADTHSPKSLWRRHEPVPSLKAQVIPLARRTG